MEKSCMSHYLCVMTDSRSRSKPFKSILALVICSQYCRKPNRVV
ncbi:hypothetical protein E1A91_D05G308600v1 [Gossypium mustelinum]|uniref:Uncharacterized protein n=1 Tax=Gossypium mustelinum TaxID=34275 RepID=A0A5D2V305_GOSMU|nr:hypothetical protein E1A91_D05G308600v1 [Gossypium mustelinum]